jgi:hypothetical protein
MGNKSMTWVIAGLSSVCKTVREGFDSLPRLHIIWDRKGRLRRYFGVKPTSAQELYRLLSYHHKQHVEQATKATNYLEKNIALSKELSTYKRTFGKLPPKGEEL